MIITHRGGLLWMLTRSLVALWLKVEGEPHVILGIVSFIDMGQKEPAGGPKL